MEDSNNNNNKGYYEILNQEKLFYIHIKLIYINKNIYINKKYILS